MNLRHLEQLEKFSTENLMNLMTNAMRCNGKYEVFDTVYGVDEIYEILKERAHSPNKEEARYIRRLETLSRDNKHGGNDR